MNLEQLRSKAKTLRELDSIHSTITYNLSYLSRESFRQQNIAKLQEQWVLLKDVEEAWTKRDDENAKFLEKAIKEYQDLIHELRKDEIKEKEEQKQKLQQLLSEFPKPFLGVQDTPYILEHGSSTYSNPEINEWKKKFEELLE